MREIKFKFWLGHTGKMTHEHTLIDIASLFWDFTEDIIPLQYTGLKDINGTEIYEGDILQNTKNLKIFQPIQWTDGQCCNFVCTGWDWNQECTSENVVIGNIYETPHLIIKD
jgi:hypothetical protein